MGMDMFISDISSFFVFTPYVGHNCMYKDCTYKELYLWVRPVLREERYHKATYLPCVYMNTQLTIKRGFKYE